MICSREWTYQNVLGALRARPNDQERMVTLASVLIELFGPDAERAICNLAVSLRILRDKEAFDPTIFSKVRAAIWPEVSASSAFLTYVLDFATPKLDAGRIADYLVYGATDMLDGASIAEVKAATHELVWAIIERSAEIEDEDAAVRMAFAIMEDARIDEYNNQED